MDDICVRVKLIRTSFKMSQKDFSLRLGVTNAHISRIEKGLTRPSAALVKLICQTYNINEQWLLTGQEPMMYEQLLTREDDIMQNATSAINKLLRANGIIRSLAVEIESLHAEIVTPPNSSELVAADYLTRCYSIFEHIQNFLSSRKLAARNQQTKIDVSISETLRLLERDLESMDTLLKNMQQ